MRQRFLLLFGALLLWLPLSVTAQDAWTLEQCIKYAWQNNLNLKQQYIGVTQQENVLFQSKMALAPSLSAGISESINWGQSVDLSTLSLINHVRNSNTSVNISSQTELFGGMQKWQTIKKEELNVQIAQTNVEKLKNDLSIEITRAYLNILLAQEMNATAKQSRESVAAQRQRTKQLVDAGSQPLSALLEIESQLASEEVQVVETENNLRTHLLTLRQLLDLPANEAFSVAFPLLPNLEEMAPVSVDELFHLSQNLPQIRQSDFNYQVREREWRIARSARYPRLSLSLSYSSFFSESNLNKDKDPEEEGGGSLPIGGDLFDRTSKGFWEQLKNNNNPSIGLTLSVPIFNQWQVNTQVKNAKLNMEAAALEQKNAQNTLFKEIQQAANDATSSFFRLKANEQKVKSLEESFRYVQQKFEVGLLNGTDFVVSKTNLFNAQSSYLQAKYEHVFKLKILDFYRGIPITL